MADTAWISEAPALDDSSVGFSPVVDSVNPNGVRSVDIEKQPPLADSQTVKSIAVGKPFHVAMTALAELGDCKEDAPGRIAVNTPPVGARCRLPKRTASQAEFPHDILVRDAGRCLTPRGIDAGKHFRIDWSILAHQELQVAQCRQHVGLGQLIDESMQLLLIRHTTKIVSQMKIGWRPDDAEFEPTCRPARAIGRSPRTPVCPRKPIASMKEVIPQILFSDESARLPVDRHQSASINLLVERDRQRFVPTGRAGASDLYVAAALAVDREAEQAEDSQNILSRQDPQLRHQATASSSRLARMVGFGAIPNSAKSSPSR